MKRSYPTRVAAGKLMRDLLGPSGAHVKKSKENTAKLIEALVKLDHAIVSNCPLSFKAGMVEAWGVVFTLMGPLARGWEPAQGRRTPILLPCIPEEGVQN